MHPSTFKLSQTLAYAIRKSNLRQVDLAYMSGLGAQGRLSTLLSGEPFGPTTRRYVLELARLLNVPEEKATVSIR